MAKKKRKEEIPQFYTTFQTAQYFGVSFPTVINWINKGLMQAHRTPGGHRRIRREEIVTFARNYNYPLSSDFVDERGGECKVLVVEDKRDVADMISDYLGMKGYQVSIAYSAFQAGYHLGILKPHVIVLDLIMADVNAFDVVRFLREKDETRHIPIVAIGNYADPELDERVDTSDFDARIKMPLKLVELVSLIDELTQPAER